MLQVLLRLCKHVLSDNSYLKIYCLLQVQKWRILEKDFSLPGGELGKNLFE